MDGVEKAADSEGGEVSPMMVTCTLLSSIDADVSLYLYSYSSRSTKYNSINYYDKDVT